MSNIYEEFSSTYKGQQFDTKQDEYTFGEQYERRLELKKRTGTAIKELESELNKRQFISYASLAQLTLLDNDLTLNDESASLELIRSRMVNLSYLIVEVEQGTNLSSICDNKVGLLLVERYNDNLTQVEFVSSDNLDTLIGIIKNSVWSNWREGVSKSKLDVEVLALEGKIDTNSDNISSNLVKINTKQENQDINLQTDNKNIVGAINENNDYINSNKALIDSNKTSTDLTLDSKLDSNATSVNSFKLEGKSKAELTNDIIASITENAPITLDTLNELAQALGDDPNFATTITDLIGTKQSKEDGKGLSSNDYTNEEKTKLEELYTKENLDLELDKKQNSTDELLETDSKNIVGAINENNGKINDNKEQIMTGGYEIITDITQDIELKEGYYEIVDNENNQYSVRVDSDLFISEGNVIENIAGYVRLKGVKMPCKLVIRQFPTLTNNTKYGFLELNSDFPSSETVKSLIKEVI